MILTDKSKLTTECKDVSIFEALNVVKRLEAELTNSKIPGVGLSANQIGINAKVCIIRVADKAINLANPKVINQYDLSIFENEGCLSFPDEYIATKRYNEVEIKDLFYPNGIILTGFIAVVAQHEIAHLYGKIMYDFKIDKPSSSNMKCWCGSKKVFKKCCIERIISPY